MKQSSRTWTIAVVAALAGALVAAGLVWSWQRQVVSTLEAELFATRAKLVEVQADVAALKSAESNEPATPSPVSEPATKATSPEPATSREFAYLRSVSTAKRSLVADYAQFLSGKAAAAAAKKDGAESPPPNDYYIVNENPKLRTLEVSDAVKVRLTMDDDGTSVAEGHDASFAELAAQQKAHADWASFRHYWLTIEDGIVIAIDEQFTP